MAAPTAKAKEQAQKSAKGGKSAKGDSRKGERAPAAPVEHAGAALPIPAARLREFYNSSVRERLMKQFNFTNRHQVPTLEKVVLNVGAGEALKNPKVLDTIVQELSVVTGQRPVKRKAKKSISNFALRQGQEIGASVTLRGARMWEFVDRLVTVAIPRIRDFRGLSTRAFDGRGNYTLGVKEQMIFPEINYDMVDKIHGLDITFVTTAKRDDQAYALLKELGMPFRGEEKTGGRATRAL